MPKKSEEENESEKELEEEIKETEEDIEDNKFVEFLQISTEPNPPVLEKIQHSQEIATLEQNIISTPISQDEKTQSDYAIDLNKPDYLEKNIETEQEYQTNFSPPVLEPVKISEEFQTQEFLDPLAGRMIDSSNNLNQKMIETRFIERHARLPFEKDEKKYKDVEI